LVLVGPRRKIIHHSKSTSIFHRQSYCGDDRAEPAVDLPLQFNFGSPYSSSLIVFFDFEHGDGEERRNINICDKKK